MAKSGSVIGKITEELGELGKKVVTETTKAPVDIAGKALESLGASKKAGQIPPKADTGGEPKVKEKTPVDKFNEVKDPKKQQQLARPVLTWWAGYQKKGPPEPSVYEVIQAERQQRKEMIAGEAKKREFEILPVIKGPPKPGAAFVAKKQTGSETSRNVRQG